MPRERKPRTWVKMDCEGLLRGSINYLLPLDGQAVWLKMIALSEICGGRAGYIEDNNHSGLPREYIAQELHCGVELLEMVLQKMQGDGAININGTGSIQLVNFAHYQFSEYDRQKPFRDKRKQKKSYGEFNNVLLLDEEKQKLIQKYGEVGFRERVEKLSLGIESKGYKYRSHYATILNWERRDEKNNQGKNKSRTTPTTEELDNSVKELYEDDK